MKLKCCFLMTALFISACSNAKEQCLIFVQGEDKNKVSKHIYKFNRDKKYWSYANFYSSSYDLNDDGEKEFFYYSEHHVFCGNKPPSGTGCPLRIYEYKENKFRKLVKPSLFPRNAFNPEDESHKTYICILKNKTNGWYDLKIDNRLTMKYDGNKYKNIKAEDK